MREGVRRELRTRVSFGMIPAVPAALWLCCGIVCGYRLCRGEPLLFWGSFCAGFAVLLWCVCTPRRLRVLSLLSAAGAALAVYHCRAPWQTYRRLLPRPNCGASVRGVVVSPDPVPVEGVCLRRRLVELSLCAVRRRGAADWAPCRGRVLASLPAGFGDEYASVIEADGVFLEPEGAVVPASFDYRRYLFLRGIRHVFDARCVRRRGSARGVRRVLGPVYDFRSWCGRHLVSCIEPCSRRQVLVAMSLGFREGLPPVLRHRFLRSGAIHIFAISGLHVCIVWTLLSRFMAAVGIEYRVRHGLGPFLLGFYVLMTGASPSAVRAFTMLAVLSINSARLRAHSPLNAVGVAALLLLLANPLHLFQSGFLFSFAIVCVLVLGWPHVSNCAALMCERRWWVPRHLRRCTPNLPARLVQTSGAALLAWCGSTALVAFSNGLIIPGALPMNVALSLMAYGCLALALPKILVSWLAPAWCDRLAGRALGALVGAIEELVRLGSARGSSLGVAAPPAPLVLVYYLGLAGVLWPRIGRRGRTAAGIAFACSLGLMIAGGRRREAEGLIGVWYGGESDTPAVLVQPGRGINPMLINSGGSRTSRDVESVLQIMGRRDLELYVASSRRWSSLAGAARLLRCMPAACVGMPADAGSRADVTAVEDLQIERGGRVRTAVASPAELPGDAIRTGAMTLWLREGRDDAVMVTDRVGVFAWIVISRDAGGTVRVSWRRRDGTPGSCVLYPKWEHPFTVVYGSPD